MLYAAWNAWNSPLLHSGVNIRIPQEEFGQPVGKNLEKDFALYAEQRDGVELGEVTCVTLLLQYPDIFCMPHCLATLPLHHITLMILHSLSRSPGQYLYTLYSTPLGPGAPPR